MRDRFLLFAAWLLMSAMLGLSGTITAQAQAPPVPWLSRDIGNPSSTGSTNYSSGVLTVNGSGSDIYNNSEKFRFVYQKWVGDVEIIARVIQVENSAEFAQAAVMIRHTLNPDSAHATIGLMPSRRIKFRCRTVAGGSTTSEGPGITTSLVPPYWLRLVRKGETFIAYRKAEGAQKWTYVGSKIFKLSASPDATVYVGLAVTSSTDPHPVLNASKFDHVTVRPIQWLSTDVPNNGTLGVLGRGYLESNASSSAATFTLTGAGTDIGGTADGFHYMYQTLTRDGEIIARVKSVQGTNNFSLGGVMIRQSAAASASQHATMVLLQDGTIKFRYRSNSGGVTKTITSATVLGPQWLKVNRRGSTFKGYYSSDGVTWLLAGTATIAMSDTAHIGLVVSNRDNTGLCTAKFDSVKFPQADGQWSQPVDWNYVVTDAQVLPNGKVLLWSRDNGPKYISIDGSGGGGHARVWDPELNTFTEAPITRTDIFCSGHSLLKDGRLLVTGGHISDFHGSPHANIFDPTTSTWSAVSNMNAGRWYPTNCALGNGDVLVIGGDDEHANLNTIPQVWQAATHSWRSLAPPPSTIYSHYPWTHLAPDGRVFVSGPLKKTRFLDTAGSGTWSSTINSNYGTRNEYGSSVMYDHGKVMIVGGGAVPGPTNTAEIIDLNATPLVWKYTSPMVSPRAFLSAPLLPDGKVLVTGGYSRNGCCADESSSIYSAEMWDPMMEEWTTMASMKIPRLYHATALLLPDGRILSAGGGLGKQGLSKKLIEFYSPPYLFKGSRPTISFVPTSVSYGQTLPISTPNAANITKVTLIRLPSVTHGFDQNQRIYRITNFTKEADVLNVPMPTNSNLCPPGHYMLFILNDKGVPSKAKIIWIG